MPPLDRRSFLTGALLTGGAAASALLLAGCTTVEPTPTGSPSTPSPAGPSTWSALAAAVTGTLLRPSSVGYGTAKLTENPRFDDAAPLGILRAASAADVAAGLAFSRNSSTPVAVRSGGHNYAGWSAGGASGTGVPASLVISTAGLDSVMLSNDGSSVTVGPGASLAKVYATIGARGRAIGAGSCGTVAIGGLTLGGGVGVLSRSFGLTADQLTAVEIVTADGAVHKASAETDADLFWACRGGGGGLVGIVTSLTFATRPAPRVVSFGLQWHWASAAAVVAAWQKWAPTAPNDLWSTLKLLGGSAHGALPIVTVTGTWTGSGDVESQLQDFLDDVGSPATFNESTPYSYSDAMLHYAGCLGVPTAKCTTGPGGVLERVSESGTSSMPTVPLGAADISTVIARVEAAASVVGLTEGGISLDALGGAVGVVGPGDTAFPHRSALMSVQYSATFADGASPAAYDRYVQDFRAALTATWGESAYVNYVDPTLDDPAQSYFGDNATRLRAIKKKVDPSGLFAQPHLL